MSEACEFCEHGKVPAGTKDFCKECSFGRTASPGDEVCALRPSIVCILVVAAALALAVIAFLWRQRRALRELNDAINVKEGEKKHNNTRAEMLRQSIQNGYRWRVWKSKILKAQAELLKQERKYSSFEAFLDIVQDGDIKLLRGSWLANQANISRFVRQQELKAEAFWDVNELRSQIQLVHFVIVSYCWLHPVNPDPESKHLELIQHALKKRLEVSGEGQVQDIAIVVDYMSLAQHGEERGENGEFDSDPRLHPAKQRTDDEQKQFDRGLRHLNIPYAHKQVQVWLMKWTPEGHPEYMDRGWPFFEQAVAGLVKDTTKLVLLEREALKSESWDDIYNAYRTLADGGHHRDPPLLPSAFDGEIMKRKFTNGKNPQAFVAGLYKRTFEEVIGNAEVLWFVGLAWGDKQAKELAAILGECKRLKQLLVCNNPIGKSGALALVVVASQCETLELLDMTGNAMSEREREDMKEHPRSMQLELRVDGKTLKAIESEAASPRKSITQEIELAFLSGARARTRPMDAGTRASSSRVMPGRERASLLLDSDLL